MMDPFFFRNRLSGWLDGELSKSELQELTDAMEAQPELQAEADAFRARVEAVRGLKLPAPPDVLVASMQVSAPSRRPTWILAALGVVAIAGIWATTREKPEVTTVENPAAENPAAENPPETPAAPPPTDPTAETTAKPTPANPVIKPSTESSVLPALPKARGKGHSRLTVVIPKDIIEDPDATDYADEDPLPKHSSSQSFRYRLNPDDPNNALKSLKELVSRLGGQFQSASGGAKATYPLESGSVDRVLLKVSAANVGALVGSLSTVGTVGVVAQPEEIPPSGMVGVLIEIEVPPQ
jgi:hypothetical protein